MRRLAAIAPYALIALFSSAACGTSHDSTGPSAAGPTTLASADAGAPPRPPKAIPKIWGLPALADENPDPNVVEVHLTASRARAALDGKDIDVLAYNGTVPGPLIQAKPGNRIVVHFDNELGEPTTVHWHGLRVPESEDGSPRIQTPVPNGERFTYELPIYDAGTFWYHPHVHTNDQLERGLYGMIAVTSDDDPDYDLERALVLDDVLFDADGNIAPENLTGFDALTGRWGKVLLTNGKNSKDAVGEAKRGQVERWRIVNTANARKMMIEVEGARARIIGVDGGLLQAPVPLTRATLPVGGRVDLEVSYDTPGTAKLMSVIEKSTGDERDPVFAVNVADGPDAPRAIAWPTITPAIPDRPPTSNFAITFDYVQNGNSASWYINGQTMPMEPILTVNQGATVKITLSSATVGVEHPFHLHGQFFRVLDPAWPGLRDTVMVPATGSIDIVAYMDNPGRWMAHCHILEHAELGMMAEIQIDPKTGAPSPGHETP